jgi:multiple antibiotic resistance protein
MWVVVDPLGTLPVMIAVSAGLTAAAARRMAVRAVLTAFCVLAGFMLFGRAVLDALDISLISFEIAGGLVLFVFALQLIFADPKHERDLAAHRNPAEAAVFPLAIPSLASPGAMLTATLTAEEVGSGISGAATGLAMLGAVMASALAILWMAEPLHARIGDAGAALISRVMGMILAAIAVNEVLRALGQLGVIPAI